MFWNEADLALKKRAALRVPPPIPHTGWLPPSSFPNLSNAVVIGLDTETKETDFDHGPGWARGKSSVVGFSIAAEDRQGARGKWYFPIRHEVETHLNLDAANCLAWLKCQVETPHLPKIGANLTYDLGTLADEGIYVQGELNDVQFAESILDESGFVALEWLGRKYLKQGKTSSLLYEWAASAYGGNATDAQRANIYRSPPSLVGPYAEDDADLPMRVFAHQKHELFRDGLWPVYRMECDLIRLLIRMRQAGSRVDVGKAEQLYHRLGGDIADLYAKLTYDFGVPVESVGSNEQLARLFDHVGVKYPRTEPTRGAPDGNPSFQKEWLKALDHPVGKAIKDIREHEKIRGTFVKSYILEKNVNGKIHCQLHPLKAEEGGAKTGRFSSSDPNLQNIPIRSELGKELRKIFIPDDGHIAWEKDDYSQIEYRMLAHFAVDDGDGSADKLRATYCNDPDTDYHDVVQNNVLDLTGITIERRPIKNINFGLLYGQSEHALAYKAGFNKAEAKGIFTAYHAGAPYVRPTMKAIGQEVQTFGYITTIAGRRCRFPLWEPEQRDFSRPQMPLPYDEAVNRYGSRIKRAGDYRGVNYKLQGSGTGDIIKAAMLECWNSGVFEVIGVPRLQVHDELDFSVADDMPITREAFAYMRRTLETATPCRVPIKVDSKRGATWGDID